MRLEDFWARTIVVIQNSQMYLYEYGLAVVE